jgi:hypothetical protein
MGSVSYPILKPLPESKIRRYQNPFDDYRRLSNSNWFERKAYSEVMKIRRLLDPR